MDRAKNQCNRWLSAVRGFSWIGLCKLGFRARQATFSADDSAGVQYIYFHLGINTMSHKRAATVTPPSVKASMSYRPLEWSARYSKRPEKPRVADVTVESTDRTPSTQSCPIPVPPVLC